MKITACPLCGSKKVVTSGISDGVNPHEFLKQACKNCGWTGFPLEFDSENDYQKFLIGFKKEDGTRDKTYYEDPAKSAPIRRYLIRSFWVIFLYLLILIIPAFVYILISELAGFQSNIGGFFAFLSFFVYIYILWKKELWNIIKR
jgi:hypothetical protein